MLSMWMAVDVTPKLEQVPLAVINMCSLTLGLGLGPLLCPLAAWALGAVGTRARSAAVEYVLAALWGLFAVALLACFPHNVQELMEAAKLCDDASRVGGTSDEDDCAVEQLDVATREDIWRASLVYGFERALIVSALEAGTALVLEIEFGWSTSSIGVAVGLAFFAAVPLALLGGAVKSVRWFTMVQLMLLCAGTGCVASICFFPWVGAALSLGSNGSCLLILIADAIVFSAGYLSNGIVDGLAIRVSEVDSFYNSNNFILIREILQNLVARMLGPSLARFLLSFGGRSLYAALQQCISVFGFLSCMYVARQMAVGDTKTVM